MELTAGRQIQSVCCTTDLVCHFVRPKVFEGELREWSVHQGRLSIGLQLQENHIPYLVLFVNSFLVSSHLHLVLSLGQVLS